MFEITLTFKAKRDYNRFLRNLKNNKGTVIHPNHLHLGEGFFDTLKSFANNAVAKNVVKALAPIAINSASQAITGLTGSQTAGKVVGDLANAGVNAYTNSPNPSGNGLMKKGGSMKRPPKGSPQMKQYMAYLRSKKGRSIMPL